MPQAQIVDSTSTASWLQAIARAEFVNKLSPNRLKELCAGAFTSPLFFVGPQ